MYFIHRSNRMNKVILPIIIISSIIILSVFLALLSRNSSNDSQLDSPSDFSRQESSCINRSFDFIRSIYDKDNDGKEDQTDILESARERTQHEVNYIDTYYSENEGKPPDDEGVCTDLFWRGLDGAGYDFQELLYQDMIINPEDYPLGIWGVPEPNRYIDFRRVPNIEAYLNKFAQSLTTKVEPCNYENLNEWQGGDIVIFMLDGIGPSDHIAFVSDKRDRSGLPYLIHNYGFGTVEQPGLMNFGEIVGHYRWNG